MPEASVHRSDRVTAQDRHLEISAITKSYEAVEVLRGVSLTAAQGEIVTLLGPSGCGKTTTLRAIAGFLPVDSGSIRIAGRDLVNVPAYRRDLGMVFQNYALFPHFTVAGNILFGLDFRNISKPERENRLKKVLDLVRLAGLENRYPKQLSGGQQQRVALARALVIEPQLVLLDEPLSNLDAKLRDDMRVELVEILKKANITTLFVTHDQEEALAISDRVAVMNRGLIEQFAAPRDIYERPTSSFIAKFFGDSNLFEAIVRGHESGMVVLQYGEGLQVRAGLRPDLQPGQPVEIIVRPEKLSIINSPDPAANCLPVSIERLVYRGGLVSCICRCGDQRFVAELQNRGPEIALALGQSAVLSWAISDSLVFALAATEAS
jgi:putative spermidine/putrescine transport system ATP-binding protein